jgi:hypothetical protein
MSGIHAFMTQQMKADLLACGFSEEQFAQLTPQEGDEILAAVIAPDADEVRAFITTIVRQARDATRYLSEAKPPIDPGLLQMVLVHPLSDDVDSVYRYALDDPELEERMTREACGTSAAGFNVYIEGRTVRRSVKGKERGKLTDTVAVFSLVVDSDGEKDKAWNPTVPVSLTIETSPGNRHFWFFFENALDYKTAQKLGEQLRKATGGDHDTGVITQPFRVAGCPNFPGRKKRERGRITIAPTRTLWAEDVDELPLWTPERFEKEFPATTPIDPGSGNGHDKDPDESRIPADTLREIQAQDAGKRGVRFWNVMIVLKDLGFTIDGIVTLFGKYPDGIAAKYRGRLRHQVETVWAKLSKDEDEEEDEEEEHGLGEWNAALDVDPPPPRGWLLGNTFCRTFLSSLIGAGGAGKTALRYAQALSLATGRELTGEHVFQRCRVLIVSLEDDDMELRRRIRAARLHYDIPLSEVDGWLWLAAPGKKAGKLMVTNERGRAVPGNLGANLEATIIKHSIDLVMLDPFVKSHSVEENLNSAIDDVTQQLTDLATKHNIAVDAPHHVSKGQMTPGDAERGRGASAYIAAARLVYTCLPMNDDEAQNFGISQQDRRDFIRVDSGKVNIARHARNAKWFHLISITLDNATTLYPSGDEVQTVETWEPPKLWADVSNDDTDHMLTTIDAGLSDGNLYSDASRATTRAAWKVVQNAKREKSEAQCREIIRTWVKNGVLIKTPYDNPKNRNEEHGLKLSTEKREELDNRARVRARKAEAEAKAERRKSLEPLAAVLNAWKAAIGVGERRSLAHVIEMASAKINPALNAAFLAVAVMDDGTTISNVLLARWLRDFNEVPVDGLMLSGGGVDEAGSPWWTLILAKQSTPD